MSNPLDDLEMHDLLRLIYPEHIRSDDDHYCELSSTITAETTVDLGDGFEPTLADLLGRVVMLAPALASPLTGDRYHTLGQNENGYWVAVVKRRYHHE